MHFYGLEMCKHLTVFLFTTSVMGVPILLISRLFPVCEPLKTVILFLCSVPRAVLLETSGLWYKRNNSVLLTLPAGLCLLLDLSLSLLFTSTSS